MRKPSPISISSPRETITSRPSASAASASSTAAALLLTTSAASAPGQPPQDSRDVVLARPARPGRQVELEVRVAARRLAHVVERGLGERRAAEVRVDDDAGRVQDAPERRRSRRCELGGEAHPEVTWVGARLDLLPAPARARHGPPRRRAGRRRRGPARRPTAGLEGARPECKRRCYFRPRDRARNQAGPEDLAARLDRRRRRDRSSWPSRRTFARCRYRGEALAGDERRGRRPGRSRARRGGLRRCRRPCCRRSPGRSSCAPAATRLTVRPSELYALNAVATADAVLAASRRTEPERVAALVGLREVEVSPVLVERPKAIAALPGARPQRGRRVGNGRDRRQWTASSPP